MAGGMRSYLLVLMTALTTLCSSAYASEETTSTVGISSSGLALNGAGIGIGQVEIFRPGRPMSDTDATLFNTNVNPTAVFLENGAVPSDMNINFHATEVAGVLISTDAVDSDGDGDAPIGVAPGASLYSSAYNVPNVAVNGQDEAAISSQHVATQNGGDVRAINYSFGEALFAPDVLNGDSLLSQFVDWSTREHETLYVVSNPQGMQNIPVPADNFNGITVGMSDIQNDPGGPVYRLVGDQNDFLSDTSGRSLIDIVAPGVGVELASINNAEVRSTGNSYASPHVTGTVALLQQHADNQITAGAANFNADARRHQVMKAVILNSADKLEDTGDGFRLGQTRTVVDSNFNDWLASEAHNNASNPLDDQMGVGHLNAERAFRQLDAGEHSGSANGNPVPQIGWDFNTTNVGTGLTREYEFTDELPAGSWVSITLVWDREVELDLDFGTTGVYDSGDTFDTTGFNDLDIQLHFQGADVIDPPVAASFSSNNVEHLFFQIQTTGMYEFWVNEFDSTIRTGTDYAVAWWAFDGPVTTDPDPGDFDGNGMIDEQDYIAWQAAFGSSVTPGTGADGNGDGVISAADYTIWRDSFTGASQLTLAATVPEPSSILLLSASLSLVLSGRMRRSS